VFAELKMSGVVRCGHFANAIAQRKLIRIFSLSALRVGEQWGEGRGEVLGNRSSSRGRSPHQPQVNPTRCQFFQCGHFKARFDKTALPDKFSWRR
jgi:hypothetical protein